MERAETTRPVAVNFFLRSGVMEVLVCGVTALIYVATLSFGFVYDDIPQILKNPAIRAWRYVPQYFTSHVWAAIYPNSSGNYYRPFFLLWLRVNYALFGEKAAAWHLTSVACHVLATWLVFRIAERLSRDRWMAFVAALIFGVHPAHIENVAWISGVTDPLMACFLLGSFWVFLNSRRVSIDESREPRATSHEPSDGGKGESGLLAVCTSLLAAKLPSRPIWDAALSLGLFTLALLAKETAIVMPLLVVAYMLIFGDAEHEGAAGSRVRQRLGAAMREAAPYLLLVLVYGFVRLRALGGWSHTSIPIGWREVVLTWPAVLWFYIRHLLVPVGLSEFYPLDYVRQAGVREFWLPLGLILAVAAAVSLVLVFWASSNSKKVARFALLLVVIPLLPVFDLRALTAGDIVHDRYLYLPSVGFALLAAVVIRELGRRFVERPRAILQAGLTIVVAVSLAALTLAQQMQWANDILLYSRGVESAPANLSVRDNLANALLEANQPARAIPLYREVLERNPAFWRSTFNLGFAYYKVSDYQDAEDYLERAIRLDPSDSDQYLYLALAQLQMNKLEDAAKNARHALARNPHARQYHFALGLIEEASGDRAAAAAELRLEIAEHPENTAAAGELQKLEAHSGAR